MKEKMEYASPKMEVIFYDGEDVVTQSGTQSGDGIIEDIEW